MASWRKSEWVSAWRTELARAPFRAVDFLRLLPSIFFERAVVLELFFEEPFRAAVFFAVFFRAGFFVFFFAMPLPFIVHCQMSDSA